MTRSGPYTMSAGCENVPSESASSLVASSMRSFGSNASPRYTQLASQNDSPSQSSSPSSTDASPQNAVRPAPRAHELSHTSQAVSPYTHGSVLRLPSSH